MSLSVSFYFTSKDRKDGRALCQGRHVLFPGLSFFRADPFAFARDVLSHGDARIRTQGRCQEFQERRIAVGRFNENLCFASCALMFGCLQGFGAFRLFDG